MNTPALPLLVRLALVAPALLLPVACGGGGGGGGGKKTQGAQSVEFEGFSFRSAFGESDQPPLEDGSALPPSLGAPLDLVVVFHFDGVPEGPFDQSTLPVFTTLQEVTPQAQAPATLSIIPAKGTWVPVGNDVEFRPFIPTAPLQVKLSAPPEAVPGLLPDSTYTAQVSTTLGSKLGNLSGPAPGVSTLVKFGTTSNGAAYFPAVGDDEPPQVVSADPPDGADDFFPGVFSPVALGAAEPTFPAGPSDVLLTYDRPLVPTEENLVGIDRDGDGLVEPTFAFEARGTRLLVAHTVLAGTLGGHAAFPALSGLEEGAPAALDGSDVFLHGSQDGALPDPGNLDTTPSELAPAFDPSLLFAILPVDGGNDLLTVVDHVLGDPSSARDAPIARDTGLDDVSALMSARDGRLLAYDRTTRRIHELLPAIVRQRPEPGLPEPGPPLLVDLELADGTVGFVSGPMPLAAGEIVDLAEAPSGRLYALAVRDGDPQAPSVLRLAPLDLDGDGVYGASDGLFSGLGADEVLVLDDEIVDLAFVDETRVLALNRTHDTLDEIDLFTGVSTVAVRDVAGLGVPPASWPDGKSPALALAVGTLRLDAESTLLSNGSEGAVVRVRPTGMLPIGADVALMQRRDLTSLTGVSLLNSDPDPAPRTGYAEVSSVMTAVPSDGPGATVDDVFFETFDDQQFSDPSQTEIAPPAEWAISGGLVNGGLRASVGVGVDALLGDFTPSATPAFNPATVWKRGTGGPPLFFESTLDVINPVLNIILLDTDAQTFPLPDGSTPGITQPRTVFGGSFAFRDVIIPLGVRVVARGTRPLVISATRKVEIHGMIDVRGTNGLSDDTFDTGYLPVPGGAGGAGGGRGGDGHPTLFDPSGPGSLNQYVTPETGENGYGPVISLGGVFNFLPVGGRGGLSTLGYRPNDNGFPTVDNQNNDEHNRPPGGAGGTFYTRGRASHNGSGSYLVQSSSTWFPFTKCPTNNKMTDAVYGNEEHVFCPNQPNSNCNGPTTPLQCVYLTYKGGPQTTDNVLRLQPGAEPGDLVFVDGDADNDFIGVGGELTVLQGGQGGGGGGSRVDSMRHTIWGTGGNGGPTLPGPPCYPKLVIGSVCYSPSLYDAKPGAGGGAGGGVMLRSFGDIVIGRTGYIDASGGHGGGGEVVQNSAYAGGGGGGSGGAVLLQAAGQVILEGDATHLLGGFTDADGDNGAAVDVSGGFGRDARTIPGEVIQSQPATFEVTRSDGGQGGSGLIQFSVGGGDGMPQIAHGAFAFARQRTWLKEGSWTGQTSAQQKEHLAFAGQPPFPPNDLRYVDMLHYRLFFSEPFGPGVVKDNWYVLNGSFPPIIPSVDGSAASSGTGLKNSFGGAFWFDTPMVEHPAIPDLMVVREPNPEFIMKTYKGPPPVGTLETTLNNPVTDPDFPGVPGTTYKGEVIPMPIELQEPSGIPFMTNVNGVETFDPAHLITRLPVVHPTLTPPLFGAKSVGRSRWLDFNGVATRMRDAAGRPPPFFEPFHGTYHASRGPIPAGKDGQVITGAAVANKPAHYVANTPSQFGIFDPGLFGNGAPPDPPFNDIRVDAPDPGLAVANAISDNATVTVQFQGAYPIRAGSGVPDPDTLSDWVTDLSQLSGYPLVRFQVVFDLSADPGFEFGIDSFRPRVDDVRLRASY